MNKLSKRNIALIISGLVIIFSLGGAYLNANAGQVSIEKAEVSAAHISLASAGGILQEVFVKDGDIVEANTVVARINNTLIKTKTRAIILSVHKDIGKSFAPGEEIAKVIDPSELRIVAHIEENKGLKDLKVGDRATFKVDAFGGKKFYGTVDSIAPASRNSDLVFSISDKRESRIFDISIRYDLDAYTDLKDGMSAKVWVKK